MASATDGTDTPFGAGHGDPYPDPTLSCGTPAFLHARFGIAIAARQTAGLRVTPREKSQPASTAAQAMSLAKQPTSPRTFGRAVTPATRRVVRARSISDPAPGRGSSSPASRSAAVTTPASAQVATCGRPARAPL